MLGKIIACVSCLMCAAPFAIIAHYNKDSITPISFWSGGEGRLKAVVKDVKAYNHQMAAVYGRYAIAFLLTGVSWFIHPIVGGILLGLDCTLGIVVVWKAYKKILARYS